MGSNPTADTLVIFFGTFLTAGCVKTLPTARLELAIFGLGDRRLIHWATRAAYIRGGETMICQKALPLQVRLVVSCQHLSRLYNLTFSKLHLAWLAKGRQRRSVSETGTKLGDAGDWTRGLSHAKRTRYHCATSPLEIGSSNHLEGNSGRQEPPMIYRGLYLLFSQLWGSKIWKVYERDRTRTCNPQIRSLMPYPLGHTPIYSLLCPIQCWTMQLRMDKYCH